METDNSIKALYEARKVESKLAQRKMLGIVNSSLVSVDAIRKNSQYGDKCDYCGHSHKRGKQNCPAFRKKTVINVVERTTSDLCVDPVRDQSSNQEKGQI